MVDVLVRMLDEFLGIVYHNVGAVDEDLGRMGI